MQEEPFLKRIFKGDYALWVIILILSLVSVVVVYSSTVALAQKQSQDSSHFLLVQSGILLAGVVLMWFISTFLDPSWILKNARVIIYGAIILALMVFIPGVGVEKNASSRWITLPLVHIPINPFDFLRIAVILDLSRQLAIKRDIIYKIKIIPNPLKWDRNSRRANFLILTRTTIGMFLPSLIAVLIVFPENLSTAAIMCIMFFLMLLLGNVRMKELGKVFAIGFASVLILLSICMIFDIGRGPELKSRFVGFFPSLFEQTSTSVETSNSENKFESVLRGDGSNNSNYQRTYAKVAMASGGIFGKGPGNSTLRSKLPNAYDDFAYAIVVEEYGLFGGFVVLILYIALLYRGITIALRSKYYSLRLAALGLVMHIALTAFIHMSVATGNILTTGQTLPLISRGGSSILANSFALGIVLCISAHKVKKEKSVLSDEIDSGQISEVGESSKEFSVRLTPDNQVGIDSSSDEFNVRR